MFWRPGAGGGCNSNRVFSGSPSAAHDLLITLQLSTSNPKAQHQFFIYDISSLLPSIFQFKFSLITLGRPIYVQPWSSR